MAPSQKSAATVSTPIQRPSRHCRSSLDYPLAPIDNPQLINLPPTNLTPSTPASASSTSSLLQRKLSLKPRSTRSPGAPITPSETRLDTPKVSKTTIESRSHGLRKAQEKEKVPCPFPEKYGGREKCGVLDDDGGDEILMASCAALAFHENRALSAEEIAAVIYEQGWLRPPSVAVEPSAIINSSIRGHLKRCEKSGPSRQPLLAKHQLAGSVCEAALEPALHPHAFSGAGRPKGTVWYLSQAAGRMRWRNPFEGLEVPKSLPRKLSLKPKKVEKESKPKPKPFVKPSMPVKIRLVLGTTQGEDSDMTSRSASGSRDPTPAIVQPAPRKLQTPSRNILDSSDSESSDSDMDVDPGPSKPRIRKLAPPPLSICSTLPSNRSAFGDMFNSSLTPILPAFNSVPHSSPFPFHSLDNTSWMVRRDHPHRGFDDDDSTSSSGDETRADGIDDWVMTPAAVSDGEHENEEDEGKVKEATDALRVLFNMPSPDYRHTDPILDLARSPPSDISSITDSSSTATAQALSRGQLRAPLLEAFALTEWRVASSPAPMPIELPEFKPEGSPCEHLHLPDESFETGTDPEDSWMSDGELPVKADDSMSDIELNSTMGDITPEHDKQMHTAAWAQEAAEAMDVKSEPYDYASPVSTLADDNSAMMYGSRASTESRSPSSGSSELPELESLNGSRIFEEIFVGPESITLEELDQLMPSQGKSDKTPARTRKIRQQTGTGTWGCIGVGSLAAKFTPKIIRKKSSRSKRPPSPNPMNDQDLLALDEMNIEVSLEGTIGTADLEEAWAEANANYEAAMKAHKEKADQAKALFEAFRQKVKDCTTPPVPTPSTDSAAESPWADLTSASWNSTDSLNPTTPGVLSPLMLQSVSALSLTGDHSAVYAVDPKALISPPIQMNGLFDSDLSSEIDTIINANSLNHPVPKSNKTPQTNNPKSATIHNVGSSVKSLTLTTNRPIQPAPPALSPSSGSPRPSSAASTDSHLSAPTTVSSDRPITPPNAASGFTNPPARARGGAYRSICPGLDACVVNQIPVYSQQYTTPAGKKGTLLRRVDTDFVNATAFLNALSVPSNKHREIIGPPGASHKAMQQKDSRGVFYAPGVCGVWVPLAEAKTYPKKLDVKEGSTVLTILRDDLFSIFAVMAGVTFPHSASDSFGPVFAADDPQTSMNSSQSSLASSSSSKSVPDLTSNQSCSQKSSLVRCAVAAPSDAPQPKRRRATIVGDSSPLVLPTIKGKRGSGSAATPTSSNPTFRKSRASIAGDMVKPKVE
ncbi:hypothetical protein M231_04651 [Tremella mesenterica]|uniref:HTH APSES-type domain-containing protein n=1 Tax=Tremella mesenterica TaxID=5217 RepID=A0A4Q1BKI9_TREME|nr:hypothetical protein M231_04651 [Tremella mesenterica]